MNKRVVLSIGVGQKYGEGVERLGQSLLVNAPGSDHRLWTKWPDWTPTHQNVPYAFKPECLNWAREQGYEQAVWADTACILVNPLDGLLKQLARDGVVFPYSPFRISEWCSDACLVAMGLTRREVKALVPSMWACTISMDFRNETTNQFLDDWLAYSRDGVSFHGSHTNENCEVSNDPSVKGHRHDQTVATILAFRHELPFSWGIVAYDHGNTVTLDNYQRGLRQPNCGHFFLAQHDCKTQEHAT